MTLSQSWRSSRYTPVLRLATILSRSRRQISAKILTCALYMLGIQQTGTVAHANEFRETGFPLEKRPPPEIRAVEPEQVEGIEDGSPFSAEQLVELAHTLRIDANNLVVKDGVDPFYREWLCGAGQGCRVRILERLYIDNCLPLTVELFHQLAFFILSCKPISYCRFKRIDVYIL